MSDKPKRKFKIAPGLLEKEQLKEDRRLYSKHIDQLSRELGQEPNNFVTRQIKKDTHKKLDTVDARLKELGIKYDYRLKDFVPIKK